MRNSRMICYVVGCVALLSVGAVFAKDPAQSAAAAPDEVVCRDYPRPGSHMMMHVCVTEAEWNATLRKAAALQSPASAVQSAWAAGGAAPNGAAQNWGGFQRY